MSKYLELFLGEVGDLTEKTKLENKPYVAYSTKLGKVTYTVVPAKDPVVEGPADNEIWYTTTDGNVANFNIPSPESGYPGAIYTILSNEYVNGRGVIACKEKITIMPGEVYLLTSHFGETAGKLISSITLPECCQEFEMAACAGLMSLNSINIPNGTTKIGDYAFCDCYSLTSIAIPNSVTSVGDWAFSGCEGLTSATIGNSVTSIGEHAFIGCSGLTSITIPNSVTTIGRSAFAHCSSLTSITYEGTTEQWNTITKGEDWNFNTPATHVQCTDGQVPLQ